MEIETSIVIRTLNESKHLESLMQGIHDQNYRNWEIVLVDSGSSDATLEIAEKYGARIFHIPQDQFTFGRSLNIGCKQAQGKYLVFASGHVWPITNRWLKNLIEPFQETSIAMVYGRQRGTDANRLSEIRDLHGLFGSSSHILVDEPRGNNGNSAIRKDLWENQPFDETLTGLEDVDWARKVEQHGFRVYYAADAPVYHVHEETLHQVYNRYLREAIATKRMFPHFKFSWRELSRGIPYAIARDILFALRFKYVRKLPRVPASRFAQFFGIYFGVRHQTRQAVDKARRLPPPDTNRRVMWHGFGSHNIETGGLPIINKDMTLVQVAFANVSHRNNGTPSFRIYEQEYSGIIINGGGHFPKGQKVSGIRRDLDFHPKEVHAEFIVAPAEDLYQLHKDTPLKHGALVRTVGWCLQRLSHIQNHHNVSACVLGAGSFGNICAQVLRHKGIKVMVVDHNDRWLSFLDKYEVDTLPTIDSVDEFDYLIDTDQDTNFVPRLLSRHAKSTALISLKSLSTTSEVKQGCTAASPSKKYINEALGLINSGDINLEDHTASVSALDDYDRTWKTLENGNYFNVLLNSNRDLEDL